MKPEAITPQPKTELNLLRRIYAAEHLIDQRILKGVVHGVKSPDKHKSLDEIVAKIIHNIEYLQRL